MNFKETKLKGACIIGIDKNEDDRGFFARTFCRKEFSEHGLNNTIAQCSISQNHKKGTLRGMHYQVTPHEEVKIVQCISGAIYDVIIDLRKDSSTYMEWEGIKLSENNYKILYIPEGFAHGFQTLEDNTNVYYQISEYYRPGASAGIRWDDAAFNIKWPLPVAEISEKDRSYSNYSQ